ncbi:conserved hypothetical protein [Thiocapsa sp. KS1]|nr:conserved hypothetical protein [Thiocapsa sp. KS1]
MIADPLWSRETRRNDVESNEVNLSRPQYGPRLLETRAEIREAGIAVARAARRELRLFGPVLDRDLYNAQEFLEAVKRLALARPDVPVRALLSNSDIASQSGSYIVDLAQRLPSRIAIRRLADDAPNRPDAFLIGDERAYVRRPVAEGSEAIADMHGRREARRLRDDFEQMWERSETDVETRRLHL